MFLSIAEESEPVHLFVEVNLFVKENPASKELLILAKEKHYGWQVGELNVLLL